ncbi:MAG: hypothetical protein V9E89_18080 [Ilumatobacteraceae bacterium]
MGAVDLAPPSGAVGAQPQVGLVEVTEQQELAHVPQGVDPQHVLDSFAADVADHRPALVLPDDARVLTMGAVPGLPPDTAPVGAEGLQEVHPASLTALRRPLLPSAG